MEGKRRHGGYTIIINFFFVWYKKWPILGQPKRMFLMDCFVYTLMFLRNHNTFYLCMVRTDGIQLAFADALLV